MISHNIKLFMLAFLWLAVSCTALPVEGKSTKTTGPSDPVITDMSLTPTSLPTTPTLMPVITSTEMTPLYPVSTATPALNLERPNYFFDITYDYDRYHVTVEEIIVYPNLTGQSLHFIVLAVPPNSWNDCFHLTSISVNEQSIPYSLDGRRMSIELPDELPPKQLVKITIQYQLQLPFIEDVDPTVAGPRIFGYSSRQQNLTNWYPFIVPFINGEWILHEPSFQGEFLVYDAADFDVKLRFANPDRIPIVASSGFANPENDPTLLHYTIQSSRTFVLSASYNFQVAQTQVGDVFVYSYYHPLHEKTGQSALNAVANSIEIYNKRFGQYPHKSMSIVLADFRGSMEYSALFFHGCGSEKLFDGTQNNEFISIAAHESAHQWWFDQVGNDQALHPWLDEALATYSEHIYYETVSPGSVNGWWWPVRVDLYQPEGYVDITIYDLFAYRPYVNAVYLDGAHFLEEIRKLIGDEAFFSFLQEYYSRQKGTIANPNDFFSLLHKHAGEIDITHLIKEYFQGTYNTGG